MILQSSMFFHYTTMSINSSFSFFFNTNLFAFVKQSFPGGFFFYDSELLKNKFVIAVYPFFFLTSRELAIDFSCRKLLLLCQSTPCWLHISINQIIIWNKQLIYQGAISIARSQGEKKWYRRYLENSEKTVVMKSITLHAERVFLITGRVGEATGW